MADKEEIKKFREVFDDCMEKGMSKLDMKKISDEKRQGMLKKFKKLIA